MNIFSFPSNTERDIEAINSELGKGFIGSIVTLSFPSASVEVTISKKCTVASRNPCFPVCEMFIPTHVFLSQTHFCYSRAVPFPGWSPRILRPLDIETSPGFSIPILLTEHLFWNWDGCEQKVSLLSSCMLRRRCVLGDALQLPSFLSENKLTHKEKHWWDREQIHEFSRSRLLWLRSATFRHCIRVNEDFLNLGLGWIEFNWMCHFHQKQSWLIHTLSLGCCYFSVTKSCPALRKPMGYSMPGFPVLHYLPEFAQIHVHWVDDAL